MYTNVETYRVRQNKTPNTKTAISQKYVNIFAPNFAFLFNIQLLLFHAVFTRRMPE